MDEDNWESDDYCLRRAVRAGLRYAGIYYDDCKWIPPFSGKDSFEEVTRRYPALQWIGKDGEVRLTIDNKSALVCYRDKSEETSPDDRIMCHAIFISDMFPFAQYEAKWCDVYYVITGWESLLLNEHDNEENCDHVWSVIHCYKCGVMAPKQR